MVLIIEDDERSWMGDWEGYTDRNDYSPGGHRTNGFKSGARKATDGRKASMLFAHILQQFPLYDCTITKLIKANRHNSG